MKDNTSEEKVNSFVLNRKYGGQLSNPASPAEQNYERLRTLYGVSKLLARFESVTETFPRILNLAAETFPVSTVVLIDHWRGHTETSVWRAEEVSHEQSISAALNAREIYTYLYRTEITDLKRLNNCIVLPLIVDGLPAHGVIQLQGVSKLNERDLEFVDALAGLIAVALDRYYKTLAETEVRLAQDQLNTEKISRLEIERELREGFVSLLTHDLRTPLAAAKLSAQLINGNGENNQEFVKRIVRNVNRADEMISNLLDANRIRSGEKLPIHPEPMELNQLIHETLADLILVHGERFVYSSAGPVHGKWDPRGVRRIVDNLCNNAIKYGASETPVVINLEQNDQEVWISIQNQGELISLADQKSIFQQFRRTETAQTGKKRGWGIGLTLVKGVAEAHGGSVTVKSEVRSGTVFIVTLPKLTH